MNTMLIIIGLSLLALIIGIILSRGDGGPRVTTIERRHTKRDDEEDGD